MHYERCGDTTIFRVTAPRIDRFPTMGPASATAAALLLLLLPPALPLTGAGTGGGGMSGALGSIDIDVAYCAKQPVMPECNW